MKRHIHILNKQIVGDYVYWKCVNCPQKFFDAKGERPWDGKVGVYSGPPRPKDTSKSNEK